MDEQGPDQSPQRMNNQHGVQVQVPRSVVEQTLVSEGASTGDLGGGVGSTFIVKLKK